MNNCMCWLSPPSTSPVFCGSWGFFWFCNQKAGASLILFSHVLLLLCSCLRSCSRRKGCERETERNRHRVTKRKRMFLLHILLWPVILIRSEGSPATLIVLGAYGSPVLPLLLTRNLIPTPGAWMRIFFWSSCLCPRPLLSPGWGIPEVLEKNDLLITPHSGLLQILVFSYCLSASAFSESLKSSSIIFLGFVSTFLERHRIKHSDSILPRTSTYGHFILIHVPVHLVLHLQNYKCVYFHVSSFCKFSGEEIILSNDLLDITLQNNLFSEKLLKEVRSSHLATEKCSFWPLPSNGEVQPLSRLGGFLYTEHNAISAHRLVVGVWNYVKPKEGTKINTVNKNEMNMTDIANVYTTCNHCRQIFKVNTTDLFCGLKKNKISDGFVTYSYNYSEIREKKKRRHC